MIQKDYHGSKPGLAPWMYPDTLGLQVENVFNRCGVTAEEVGVT